MKICALIPVYDNADTITDVIARCRTVIEPDILVVADGPTDDSETRAHNAGATVISLPENQGKGTAIRCGLAEAQDMGYTHAIVIDADGQHLPEEIPRMIEAVWNFPSRLWVGVRDLSATTVPKASRIGRCISNFWTTVNGWQRCRDAQCGFRAYPIKEILALKCRETGFTFEMEVLVRAAWAGLRFGHVDVNVIYPSKETRISHFKPRRDNLRASWLSCKLFFGMLIRSPFLIYRKLRGT